MLSKRRGRYVCSFVCLFACSPFFFSAAISFRSRRHHYYVVPTFADGAECGDPHSPRTSPRCAQAFSWRCRTTGCRARSGGAREARPRRHQTRPGSSCNSRAMGTCKMGGQELVGGRVRQNKKLPGGAEGRWGRIRRGRDPQTLLIWGSRWLSQRSRHCLPSRPEQPSATAAHFTLSTPSRVTMAITCASSSSVHFPFLRPGLTTLDHRYWHSKSVYSPECSDAIFFQSRAPCAWWGQW